MNIVLIMLWIVLFASIVALVFYIISLIKDLRCPKGGLCKWGFARYKKSGLQRKFRFLQSDYHDIYNRIVRCRKCGREKIDY